MPVRSKVSIHAKTPSSCAQSPSSSIATGDLYPGAVLVVHGLWRSGRLALWAEDSALPTSPVSREHPFAVRPELDGEPGSATLLLPTVAGRPADSPELVRDEEPVGGPVELAAWTVPTADFEPDEALAILCE